MKTVSETVRSTPTQWISVFLHVASLEVKKQITPQNTISKIKRNINLLTYNDIVHHTIKNLNSRYSTWEEITIDVDPQVKWKRIWLEFEIQNLSLIENPIVRTQSFNVPCGLWTALNSIRTEQENATAPLYQ